MSQKAERKKGITHSLRERVYLKVPTFASKLNTLNREQFVREFQCLWVYSQCRRHRRGVERRREREREMSYFFKYFSGKGSFLKY